MAPGAAMEESDENMINSMVMQQDLPNMSKLQALLRSLCARIKDQAHRIELAEEHGRAASLLKDEFEHLSQKVLEDLKTAQEAERNNIAQLIDDKLKGVDGKVDDLAKQFSDLMAVLHGADLSILKSLPDRLAEMEQKTSILQDQIGLQIENAAADSSNESPVRKLSVVDQSDRIQRLEDQLKDLKTFVQDAAKVNTSDIGALQKITRNIRNDLDMLPIVNNGPSHLSPSGSKDGIDIAGPLNELQNRLQRKADKETVDQLIRSAGQVKESLEKMRHAYDELKQLAGLPPSRRTSLRNSKTLEQINQVISSGDEALNDLRLKQLQDEIASLTNQLAAKADRKDIDGISIQVSMLEGQVGTLANDDAPEASGEDEVEKLKSNVKGLQNALQKMQDMVAKKADRDEVPLLSENVNEKRNESPNGKIDNEMLKNMIDEIENINEKMKTLEERSDLNVLITKRLENFAQPAATVQPTGADLGNITDAINDHAVRMMEYADTLLQMETLLASKADAAGLQALRNSIVELKKKGSVGSNVVYPPPVMEVPTQNKDEPELQIVYQSVPTINPQNELVEKHEEILKQLLKDMALLGEGILTLSGHNQNQTDKTVHDQPEAPIDTDVTEQDTFLIKREEPQPLQQGVEEVPECRESFMVKKEEPLVPQNLRAKQASIVELEEALNDHLIKPKGDAEFVNKLAQEFLPMTQKMKELDDTLHALKDNTAEKDELQKMKNFIKESLAESAMFSGKGLPGFKCMSCAHRLDKLNPNRADFVPTNFMRRQHLPMQAAQRLYHEQKELEFETPRLTDPVTTTALNTNSRQLLSSPCPEKPKVAKKK